MLIIITSKMPLYTAPPKTSVTSQTKKWITVNTSQKATTSVPINNNNNGVVNDKLLLMVCIPIALICLTLIAFQTIRVYYRKYKIRKNNNSHYATTKIAVKRTDDSADNLEHEFDNKVYGCLIPLDDHKSLTKTKSCPEISTNILTKQNSSTKYENIDKASEENPLLIYVDVTKFDEILRHRSVNDVLKLKVYTGSSEKKFRRTLNNLQDSNITLGTKFASYLKVDGIEYLYKNPSNVEKYCPPENSPPVLPHMFNSNVNCITDNVKNPSNVENYSPPENCPPVLPHKLISNDNCTDNVYNEPDSPHEPNIDVASANNDYNDTGSPNEADVDTTGTEHSYTDPSLTHELNTDVDCSDHTYTDPSLVPELNIIDIVSEHSYTNPDSPHELIIDVECIDHTYTDPNSVPEPNIIDIACTNHTYNEIPEIQIDEYEKLSDTNTHTPYVKMSDILPDKSEVKANDTSDESHGYDTVYEHSYDVPNE